MSSGLISLMVILFFSCSQAINGLIKNETDNSYMIKIREP